MTEQFLVALSLLFLLGIGAQWAAWRTGFPSILLLLLCGLIAGPGLGLINTQVLLGDVFRPLVSIAVAIILFEGGLNLRFSELKHVHKAVRSLLTVGILITWGLVTVSAHLILGFEVPLALLLGAILVVTGPTVIGPLLQQIRPHGSVNAILKWEGILNDPVGAILAVILFEAILAGNVSEVGELVATGILTTFAVSLTAGGLCAWFLYVMLKNRLIPHFLHISITLTVIICLYTASNLIQEEAGLLSVTVLGIALANQKTVNVEHILSFNENLRVLLLSCLFILLAAQLEPNAFLLLDRRAVLFIAVLILIIRPLSVFIATLRSNITAKEKLFLSWMAPRGIVAAAVSSIMAFRLMDVGYPDAEKFIPLVFLVIISTILLYGTTAALLAKYLGLEEEQPQGILIIGAHSWAVQLGTILKKLGHTTLLLDNNPDHIRLARRAGLNSVEGSVTSDTVMADLDLSSIGYLAALTSNDMINTLSSRRFAEWLDEENVYQIKPQPKTAEAGDNMSEELTGKFLFWPAVDFDTLDKLFLKEATVQTTLIQKEDVTFQQLAHTMPTECILLLVRKPSGQIHIISPDHENALALHDTLIYLAPKEVSLGV